MKEKSKLKPKKDSGEQDSDRHEEDAHSLVALPPEPELVKKTSQFFEGCLQEALDQKREFFVLEILRKLKARISPAENAPLQTANGKEWVQIESLSKLRAVVGG